MSPGNADSFQACVSIGRPASALAPATLPTLSGRGPQAFSSARRLLHASVSASTSKQRGELVAQHRDSKANNKKTKISSDTNDPGTPDYKNTTVNNKQHVANRLPPDCRTPRVAPYKVEKGTFGDIGLT